MYWLVAFLSLLLAVFAYATKDRTIVVPQQLVIIPSTVTSDTWRDPEKTQIHEASDYSLYQDFSTDNSAYLDQAVLAIPPVAESISPLPPSTDSELDLPAAEGETGGDTSNEAETPKASSAEPGAPPGELEAIPLEPPESIEAEPVSVTAPEEPTANTEDTTVSALWSSTVRFVRLPLAERLFPLAQEVITTNVTSTKLSTTEPVEMGTEATVESEVPTGEVSDEEVVTEEESSAPETDGGGVESTDGGAVEESTTEKVVADETDQNDVEEVVVEEGEIEEYVTTIADFCAGDEACRLYSANFSGFAMPEFESGTFLTGAQLRLSLAAQALPGKADKPQRFVVEYIYAEGEPWRTATVIDIEDEISNSINGGYFLVSLERPSHQSFLANLKVRVSYQGDIENLKRAYIESLWLEVASAKFYEETDPLFADGAITYDRDLEQPKFHSLNNADLDQVVSKLPAFALSYSPQQGFLRRAFQSLFGDNEYKVDSVRLTDAAGTVLTVPIEVEYFADKTWTLKFLKQPQKLVPGKYRIELVVNENDTLYADAFEFYWGVLAVNTTKSMYFPNEDVALNLAALTEEGDTICDANLQLKIISPDYSIYEVPVEPTGACGKNNVTDNPDYLAFFKQTSEFGRYTVQLKNLNQKGEVVHAVEDFFEVREYIPYDIERTAPTRIYPPAPYKVALHVTAYRSYTGDIVERVPRGFVLTDYGDAEVVTMPEYTELVWRNVELKEGDELNLGYEFDAPDVSPYLYLLGPLNMDGFAELREWQIASDALTSIATFTGTRTVAGTNFNNTASPLQWSTSTIDAYYYTHATSSNSHEVTIRRSGDYFLAVNLPLQRSDANARGTRIGMEVRVNGVRVPESVGRSGYITNQSAHSESSSHSFFLLKDVVPNDVLTVYSEALTTINVADTVVVTGQASLYLELIPTSENVFSATTTRTINSTNLNQITEYSFNWTETRQDTGFTHSDSVNPEQIIIATAGTYLVEANVPLTTDNTNTNIMGRVRLDGVQVLGGQFMQGYAQAPGTESDGDSSIHFSGIFVATTTNQILTLTATREGTTGTVTVSTGLVGSVFVRKLPTTGVIALRGTNLVGGTNWNPAAAAAIQWDDRVANDSGTFTHSTSSNSHQITIASDGDYFLSYNDALTGSVIRANSRVAILKNGTAITGAQAKSHYTRNQNGQTDSSGALVTVLPGLLIGDVITVTTIAEAAAGILDDSTSGVLVMWKKATLNVRPDAPTMYNAPFDNIRFASTTPYFDFSAVDPDGTSSIVYEFSLATTTGFTASSTYNSVVSLEFFNTASSTDTSPFNEGNKIRFQLTGGAALTDLMTYYWRVRAKDITGSGEYGDWSTTQSLTVDMAESAPSWFQSYRGQFEGDTLVGTVSGGGDQIQVDASVSSEILIAYGEGAVTTPRYRFWNGTTWGVEGSAVAVSNTINWVRTAAAVSRNEYAMVTLDASDDAYAQIYSASTSSWGNQSLLSSVVTSAAYRGVAVGYESLSGDVMAISCSNGPNPVYRIWNGSSWSATSSITVSSLNNCNFLELASDPASDEIILVVRDTGTQYEALVWNGSAWVESRVIGSSALVAREGLSVAYEASGDQAMVVVSDNANNNIMYTTWSGTEFGANATQAIGNDLEFARLARDPNSDKLALCYIDTDNDIGVLRWDGGVWSTFTELDTAGNIDTGRPVECAFETLSGRSNYLMAVYSDTTNVRYRTGTSSVYSTEASVGTVEDSFWVQAKSAGNGIIMSVSLDDTADDLDASFWNGTTWSAKETLETSPSSIIAAPYEMYDMAAKRFQFSEGRATTPPIDFTSVPNQPTWGDITFSTTEPFGTNVSLRLKYSSSTVCDTYISNGVLPGNGAGFDVNDAPIDITTLSTSTYRQICLEATLTTLGSASALLNDWTLAWVRQPKLAQSNYRWYVNGSFLTPTDPWPTGATDFATNMPLSSEAAVTNGEAIRLRLSLLAKNVASPALAKTFKLQYANGLTCNQSLTWHDVGTTASTTALWRGYKNSIVGDDWYSASWVKRIKLTIPRSMVPGSQTNFPVYVNLDDLPDAFFLGVQADGDDIRVTQSNGITEVPYELVTIDTSAKTGELHFKADVSSTTESKYYIYYGNSGASGYSASATYGRNNVWTNGFLAVYHLDQSPTASTPQFTDSTGNSAGTAVNLEVGDRQTGQVGRAIDFDGTNEYIDTNFNRTMLRSTWSLWLRTDGAQGAYDGLFTSQGTLTNGLTVSGSSTRLGYNWRDAVNTYTWVGAPIYPTNAWFMASLVVEPTQATVYSHTGSGVTSAVNTVTHATATVDGLDIGQDSIGSRLYNGLVDEATLANTVRSATWLATTYNNKANSTGFYSVSSEELINDGRTLPSTILSGSDYPETYEEENPTRENQNALPVGDEAEWDFVLQPNNAAVNTNYCFRMVYGDGSLFNTYTNYPRLITNAPPLAPELYTPFNNERLASTTPWFEFASTDERGDGVTYQIQIDTEANFGSPDVDTDSVSQFALFTNLLQPSQKSEFTSGQRIRFEGSTPLTNGNTYWWRVRSQDMSGSATYSDWSTPHSVTINTATAITTWFQTTGSQLATNNLLDTITSTSTNDIGIDSGFTAGTTTSKAIDYDNRTSGNAWGDLSFTHNVTSGTIRYYVEYLVAGDTYSLVPDAVLVGNSSGLTTSPVSLANLNTTTYNELRLRAVFSGNSILPRLQDWTVTWAKKIEIPTLTAPFDNAKVSTTTPALTFYSIDPESDSIQYELQLASASDFAASSTFTSGVSAGFVNVATSSDTSPFNSGESIRYTVQSALSNGNTYWWRVRARDPSGDNVWSEYSNPQSFTVDTAITVSAWHQSTGDQFATDVLTSVETTAGAVQITTTVNEVLMAYGEGTGQAPRYRLWNGTVWGAAKTAVSVGAQIRWTDLEAASTRSEYALGTIGTDNDVNVQIYNANTDTWGNVSELVTNIPDILQRGFDIAYETTSGKLLAVSCEGDNAVYSVWNGTSWTATSSLSLANTNSCLYVELASDPTSNEIVAVFKHANTNTTDYELKVWSGSAWGNTLTLADMSENANAGAAVVYEASGDQAIVALTNDLATTLLYALWSGTAWSTSTQALGDHLEWAALKRDVGTDKIALCYTDNDTNIGVLQWSGSAWGTFTEIEQIANGKAGQSVDCAFETLGARDGYLMAPYSDATNGRYQFYATSSFNGELGISVIEDSWRVMAVRGGDGLVHTIFFDDTNDRYDTSRWNGTTWSTRETLSATPSITGTPFDGSLSLAARTYPVFTSGSVRSTSIDFANGAGPRWERINFIDITPGSSDIKYRLYYLASTSMYELVPDSVLSGNSTGFTNSPVDISGLDRTVYKNLKLDAQFVCVSGSCPTLNEWTVEWSAGITVSGTAYEYDASTTLASGTVAVAVNGVTQAGKTATILGDGTWSISNVTAFQGDLVTIFIDGAIDTGEAVAVTIYDGIGNITGVQLARRNLTLGSVDNPILRNSDIAHFDNADDEDIFFTVSGSNLLTLCVESGCATSKLRILSGTTYQPDANSTVVNFANSGTFSPATNTIRVSGSWTQNGTFNTDASSVIFTATTSSLTLDTSSSTLTFNNLTLGETSGVATWSIGRTLAVLGSFVGSYGTLARGTSSIVIAQNLQFGAAGYVSGLGTTTFSGSGSHTWGDAKSATTSSNMGYVVVDGTAKTITLAGNVGAQSVIIGSDDTLNASGSGYNINVAAAWSNNNAFIAQTGTVTFIGTSTATINRGASAFNHLSFTGVGGNWSFSTTTLAVGGNFTIATGTVTLPTGTTTIAGSFNNTGGTFLHNNGEVRMTSLSGGRTLTQSGTAFLNSFYDLVFTGSGAWSFSEARATTTRNFRVTAGTVTFPSSTLTVGGDFLVTGTGAFTHNSGEVILLVLDTDEVRTNGASFNNVRTVGSGLPLLRTFADTTLTVLGNLIIDTGGDVVFPTGVLSIGGSFDNNATFNASVGTIRFNSIAGVETIAAGSSAFATLEFNSTGGDFTVTESATATVAINLTTATQFTLLSGVSLAAQGTFTNALTATSTTWTGSTLRFLNANTATLNSKTHAGDTYGTLAVASSTLVKMWNSSATTYSTQGTTSAIYSQDHAGVDGDLYMYGNYLRTTGTEYWSYATDFDGVALSASTSRQVDVRIATSSQIGFTGASLNMIGTAAASTTLDAQAGAYSLNATNTTITAENFRITGTDTAGFGLRASTTLSVFRDGHFTVNPSRSAITVDASTVDTNPTAQYYRVGFATSSPGTTTNVTLSGSPSSFIWFREGTGGLYGEAYDGADANPGAIRFDDSSNTIIVSGTVYNDAGATSLGGPTCDGVTNNVRVVVDGGSYASSTSCNAITGAYSFASMAYVGDPKVVVYLDTNGGVQGSVITKTPTSNITNMHIYANRVITRHQDVSALTLSDMQTYDFDNDSDLRFIAATTSLTVLPNTELFVFASSTLAPGGNITLSGNGNANSYEGTLQLGVGATFTATGTETHTLAGRFVLATTSTFIAASSTFIFNATTTGKSITSPNTVTFNQLQFNGQGGGWNITAPLIVQANMHIATGTVTGTGNLTLNNGSLYGNGMLSLGAGTTTINRTNTLGGISAWTFHHLVLGNGTVVGTTTSAGTATSTISGSLTIANAHFLQAGSANFDLAGSGTVFTKTGTFLEGTSTMRFSGAGSTVPAANYYNLRLDAGVGTATYTAAGAGSIIYNDLTIGGTANSTFNQNTNDPVVEVRGDVVINSTGTFEGSNSAALTMMSDWTNVGTFNGNSGTVTFAGSATTAIAAGNSSFSNVLISGTGAFSVTGNATTTASFLLTNHTSFTLASGTTLAVGGQFTNSLGGAATTWSSSTLALYGTGTYSINASTTNDIYYSLRAGNGTQIRLWNSSATNYSVGTTGSLYSQDHSGVNGSAYIWGQLIRASGADYWSYATDFDGSNLAGGSERAVHVYFASSSTATWAGANLFVLGSTSATTTLANQGAGTYALTIGTGATTEWNRVQIRDISSDGVVLTGVLAVTDFSRTDHLVAINNGSAITVGGTAINANPAKNFTNNFFAVSGGVTTPKNVTATGTAVTSWRFTNHSGNLAGEAYDSDPAGDPGYIVWDDSAALITIAGNVYSDEGSTVSTVCNGVTTNIRLVVAGLTTYNASCNAVTGAYSIPNVAFSPLDTLTLYINGETPKAVNVSVAPISSISNMNLYHDRVIVRHENTDPLTIANMAVWDSSDDADIIFTAVDAGSDTLALPANAKLLIWTGKTFEPNGNVTLAGGGAGNPWDGTLEAQANARFRAKTTEVHSVGGSVTFGIGADFVTASSTLTLTTSGASRTFDVNASTLHNLTMSGSGSYSMTDAILTTTGSYTQSAGSVTFPTGTTTIGAAFNVTGGSFTHAGSGIVFTSNGAGNTVRFNNSVVPALTFSGSGSWSMTDVNATSTGAVMISAGAVTLPTGNLAVGGSFVKRAGTLTHNTSDIIMTATSSALLTASSSDLYAVHFAGPATFTITDTNITFLDSFTVASGSVAMASGTTAVGGSLTATGGVFTHATGTVLLNATSSGRTINPGSNTFFNLQLGAPTGGYTLSSATTTNNLTIASVSSLLVNPTATIAVGGVFTNSVGGAATTWSNTTLRLFSQNEYTINSKSVNGDVYGTLTISPNTDIRAWYSSAATTTIASSSSLYSQDHGNTNGELYIYGDYVIATTTEYWSYATDFDGAVLTGLNQRQAKVYFATNATTTVMSGSLHIVGASSTKSQIQNQTTGTYSLAVNGGTINANYYEFSDLNNRGLVLSGLATITNLANGYFDLAVATGTLISLSSTTLNANPSKIFDNVGFTATTGLSGYNVTLTGETSNAWRFTNHYGTLAGEAYDVDGIDACGSVRFADSACLLTEQTHIRWRNDNGGEGAPNSEWFNSSFDYRTRVRVLNNDNDAYASTAIKVAVPYQSVMQSDFDDIRFTSADGLTVIPFWIEKYTASTDAQIWVRLPSLPASNYATVFMYFGSSTAASLSNGDLTFDAFDDYEDNSISEYSGDTSLFNAATSPVYGGIYSLKPTNASGKTTDGIFRFDDTVSQGKIIRYMQYVNTTAGSGDEPCTLFGVQSPGTTNSNYGVCLEQFGTDRIALARDIDNNDTSGVVLATSTVTYATGWYEVEIDWRTNNTIFVSLFNSAGTRVASTTATDSTYTSGGYGYAFWFQNGAWDSFTARNRVATKPTVYLGAVQTDGGATWLGALDTIAMAVPGNTVRLRVAIENSGLDVTEQLYRLEYAAKGVAPTCESVSNGSYATVLNQVSCGMSPICMQTSTYVSNGAPTTDLLSDTSGTFRSGEIVTSPSTQTNSFALNQNYYSELEYVLTPTLQASDALCLRVTNNGTPLDFYNKVAELGLKFNPMLSLVTLNNGLNITLTPGTTTEVTITATTTDYNGYADLTHATTTLYRSVAGPACLANNNDCYSLSTENGRCSFTGCSGNSCRLTCQANVAFHADPTDFGSYEGQEWLAYTEIEDAAGGYDFDSAPGVELSTLRALQVNSLINYGTLQANSNTGSFNPTTTVANLGNTPINVDVVGSDLTDGGSSAIPAERQKMSTSSFAYGACVSCYQLSSSSAVTLNINLTKPIVANPPVQTSVYWGIEVPLGINSTPHSGTNIFTAKGV